jgi:O-antigen ligase
MTNVLYVIFVLSVLLAGMLCLFRPSQGLVALIVMFPVKFVINGYNPATVTQTPLLINGTIAVLVGVCVALCFTSRRLPLRSLSNPCTYLVVFFYAFACLSLLWSPRPDSAWFFMSSQAPYLVLWFILAPMLISRLHDLDSAVKALFVIGSFVVVFYLINPGNTWAGGRLVIDLGYAIGIGEVGSNPLAMGDLGGMLAIAAALYRAEKRTSLFTVIQVAAFGLGIAASVASGSRGQLLASIALSAAFFPLLKGQRNIGTYFIAIIALTIFAGIAYSIISFAGGGAGMGPSAESRWNTADLSTALTDRFAFATALIANYTGSPQFWLQGLGAGAFNQFYSDPTMTVQHTYPHNIFVEALAELGLLGLTMLLAICFYTASQWFKLYRLVGVDNHTRSLCVILLGFTVFHFLLSLKQGTLWGYPQLFMFALILCKVSLREQHEAAHQPESSAGYDQLDAEEIARLQAEYAESDARVST